MSAWSIAKTKYRFPLKKKPLAFLIYMYIESPGSFIAVMQLPFSTNCSVILLVSSLIVLQVFSFSDVKAVKCMRLVFQKSTDFFGRVTIYELDILGNKL